MQSCSNTDQYVKLAVCLVKTWPQHSEMSIVVTSKTTSALQAEALDYVMNNPDRVQTIKVDSIEAKKLTGHGGEGGILHHSAVLLRNGNLQYYVVFSSESSSDEFDQLLSTFRFN